MENKCKNGQINLVHAPNATHLKTRLIFDQKDWVTVQIFYCRIHWTRFDCFDEVKYDGTSVITLCFIIKYLAKSRSVCSKNIL